MARRKSPVIESVSLEGEIAHLRDLPLDSLRARWRIGTGKTVPPHLPKHLLFAILAYRLQADSLGDLAAATARLLDKIGTSESVAAVTTLAARHDQRRRRLRPGTVLMRQWNGLPQHVMVLDEGFAWNGRTYANLSQIAFAITGTKWNGPRFFGLRDKETAETPS